MTKLTRKLAAISNAQPGGFTEKQEEGMRYLRQALETHREAHHGDTMPMDYGE